MMNKKETTFENYTFWDAYKEVKAGNWSEEEFILWAGTVYNEGADIQAEMAERFANE